MAQTIFFARAATSAKKSQRTAKIELAMENNNQSNESNKPSQGFLKLMRSPETEELLLNDPLAFASLANIALRARWRTKFDVHGLKFGQAMVGDYAAIGFTRQQYRSRLQRLVECGLVTTRPTPRGTIATLASIDVFDINAPLTSGENAKKGPPVLPMENGACQPTTNQRPTNSQPLTKKVRTKESSLSASDKGHSQFVRLWCERFKAVTGERYAFAGGKDGKAVKLLLTTTGLTPSQLVGIAETAWKRPTGFWCKFATSIAGYNSHFNQIRKETTDAMAITTSGRDAGKLARARRSQYAGVGKLR